MKSVVIILSLLTLLIACTSKTSEANQPGAEINSTAPQETEWEQAKELLLAGKVESLTQAHDRTVILTLKDGSQFTTKEPTLDEIFKRVEQCGAKCSEITIATE